MLGRRACRDMRGICGDMRGYAGRTTSPKSARPGCRFLDQPPPIREERETGTANDLQAEKRITIFDLTYWLSMI